MHVISDVFDVFKLFKNPIAKFDFVTLSMPMDEFLIKKLNILKIKAGERFIVPKSRKFKSFTLHDPTSEEFKYLVDNFPDMEIEALEIAIDLYPFCQSNRNQVQWELYRWLKKHLYPRQHRLMKDGCLRYNWCNQRCNQMRDRTLRMNGHGSYRYYTKNRHLFVRLYVKEIDQYQALNNVPVRIEVHLDRGGCQDLNVHRLALFPEFIKKMRVDLSPFFTVAKGIKPSKPRFRSKNESKIKAFESAAEKALNKMEKGWNKYGATYADSNNFKILSDRRWITKIGDALQGLRHKHLKIPHHAAEKVEHFKNMFDVKSSTSVGFL